MSRIRYLKPDFFKDEDVTTLSHQNRLLFAGLWVIADREGRLKDSPMRIKAELFPYEEFDVEKGLTTLAAHKKSRPFIIRYSVGDDKYIQILSWNNHQRPHHTEKDSVIPPPADIPVIFNGKDINKKTVLGNGDGECARSYLTVNGRLKDGEKTVKISKRQYGEHKNVLLSDEEHDKLITKLGNEQTEELITDLDIFIGSKGARYASHYCTVLAWSRRERFPKKRGASSLTPTQQKNMESLEALNREHRKL